MPNERHGPQWGQGAGSRPVDQFRLVPILQRRVERRATINEEVGGVYDVNVL